MPDDVPKSDVERIAELEMRVAELSEISANLYNAIHNSHYTHEALLKLSLTMVTGRPVTDDLNDAVNKYSSALDAAMTKAKSLIWGDNHGEK